MPRTSTPHPALAALPHPDPAPPGDARGGPHRLPSAPSRPSDLVAHRDHGLGPAPTVRGRAEAGPLHAWRHEHVFTETDEGTLVEDRVRIGCPEAGSPMPSWCAATSSGSFATGRSRCGRAWHRAEGSEPRAPAAARSFSDEPSCDWRRAGVGARDPRPTGGDPLGGRPRGPARRAWGVEPPLLRPLAPGGIPVSVRSCTSSTSRSTRRDTSSSCPSAAS